MLCMERQLLKTYYDMALESSGFPFFLAAKHSSNACRVCTGEEHE
jgi:hypothetical protein